MADRPEQWEEDCDPVGPKGRWQHHKPDAVELPMLAEGLTTSRQEIGIAPEILRFTE